MIDPVLKDLIRKELIRPEYVGHWVAHDQRQRAVVAHSQALPEVLDTLLASGKASGDILFIGTLSLEEATGQLQQLLHGLEGIGFTSTPGGEPNVAHLTSPTVSVTLEMEAADGGVVDLSAYHPAFGSSADDFVVLIGYTVTAAGPGEGIGPP